MHLREGPVKSRKKDFLGGSILPAVGVVKPRTAGWEAKMLPLCYAVFPLFLVARHQNAYLLYLCYIYQTITLTSLTIFKPSIRG